MAPLKLARVTVNVGDDEGGQWREQLEAQMVDWANSFLIVTWVGTDYTDDLWTHRVPQDASEKGWYGFIDDPAKFWCLAYKHLKDTEYAQECMQHILGKDEL
jgi:hypothetical protein